MFPEYLVFIQGWIYEFDCIVLCIGKLLKHTTLQHGPPDTDRVAHVTVYLAIVQ